MPTITIDAEALARRTVAISTSATDIFCTALEDALNEFCQLDEYAKKTGMLSAVVVMNMIDLYRQKTHDNITHEIDNILRKTTGANGLTKTEEEPAETIKKITMPIEGTTA